MKRANTSSTFISEMYLFPWKSDVKEIISNRNPCYSSESRIVWNLREILFGTSRSKFENFAGEQRFRTIICLHSILWARVRH